MRIENEDQNVTLDTLEQLCKSFHVDVADLFPARRGARVYQPSTRDAVAPATTMVHDSASRSSTAGKTAEPGVSTKKEKSVKSGKK